MKTALMTLLPILFSLLTPERLKLLADKILDLVEDWAKDSATEVDDAIFLPLCATIRTAFDIPDNDITPPAP